MCNGPRRLGVHGKFFYLWDCRDYSHVKILSTPLHSFHIPVGHTMISNQNLITNGDFASGIIGNWKRSSESAIGWVFARETDNNVNLAFQCKSNCNGNFIFQDVYAASQTTLYPRGAVQAGALIKAPSVHSRGTLVVKMWAPPPSSAYLGSQSIDLRFTSTKWEAVRFHYIWPFSSKPVHAMRLEFVPSSPGLWQIDEALLSVLPYE